MSGAYLKIALTVVAGLMITATRTATRAVAENDIAVVAACTQDIATGLLPIADLRVGRFLGKGTEIHVRCNGGETAVAYLLSLKCSICWRT
jgi:hypothetical protein